MKPTFFTFIFSVCTLIVTMTSVTAQGYPYVVPCGEVTELTTAETVSLTWDVPKFKEKPTLQPDELFAEVDLLVYKGRSVGKFDYTLSGNPCLAMAEGEKEYDPAVQEYLGSEGQRTVRLLFKVKKGQAPYSLVFSYAKDSLTKALGMEKTTVQLDVVSAADGGGDDGGDDADGEKPKKTKKTKKPAGDKDDEADGPPKNELW